MASRQALVGHARASLIPMKQRMLGENKVIPSEKENAEKDSQAVKGGLMNRPQALGTRRVGLAVLDKNVRRPAPVQAKKVVPDLGETKTEVNTKSRLPGILGTRSNLTRSTRLAETKAKSPEAVPSRGSIDAFAPDSYADVNLGDYLTKADIQGLIDPDSGDFDTEVLCAEYIKDIVPYLYSREMKMKLSTNFMKDQKYLLPRHRRLLVDWMQHLHSRFRLATETLYLSVYILDAYVSKKSDIATSKYQLIGMTALVLASKFEEVWCPQIDEVVQMCDKAFTSVEVLKMEREILRTLNFMVDRPVPITFLRRFSKVADVETEVHTMAKYFLELSTLEYQLVGVRPSKLAAAALFLSLKIDSLRDEDDPAVVTDESSNFWTKLITFHSRYPVPVLMPVVHEICALLVKVEGMKEKVIIEKYALSKNFRVSRHPMLRSRLVRDWASRAVLVSAEASKQKTPGSKGPSGSTTARPKAAAAVVTRKATGSGSSSTSIAAAASHVSKSLASRPAFRP